MAFVSRPRAAWKLRSRALSLGERTLVMGVLNATPDSFSDAGESLRPDAALGRALAMLEEGAAILDIGGESTRPGARPIGAQQEIDRVLPVLEAVLRARPDAILSVDTYKAEIARAAVLAGAEIVNDVSGFAWDDAMPAACAGLQCGIVLMHTRGRPSEWKTQPPLPQPGVLPVVREGLARSLHQALAAGVDCDRIVLDPGFGFGKAGPNNYPLLAHLHELLALGRPILAGVSRKSFLGQTAAGSGAPLPVRERDSATLAATTAAILAGAHLVRVHAVRPAVEAARIADAILSEL